MHGGAGWLERALGLGPIRAAERPGKPDTGCGEGFRWGPVRPCDPLYSCHNSGTFGAEPNGAPGRPAPPGNPRPPGPRPSRRGPQSVRRPPPPVGWFRQWSRFRGSVPGERAAPRGRLERLRGFEGAPRDAAPPSFRPPAPACSLSPRQLALLAAFPPAKPESLASPGALAPGV